MFIGEKKTKMEEDTKEKCVYQVGLEYELFGFGLFVD